LATRTKEGFVLNLASCFTDVPHPGELIKEEMDARGWSQRDLAFILGVPEQSISPIMTGKRNVTPDMAKALAVAFDVSADYFANLQKAYEMSLARLPDPAVERRARLQSMYPIREMIKRGWLTDTNIELLEVQVMRFFRKNSLDEVLGLAHAAKKADYSETKPEQWAWLYRVHQIASEMVVSPYSARRLQDVVSELHKMTFDPEEIRHVPRVLAECGVRYAIVESLPKAKIDGVCFWLDASSPVISMTMRMDRIDNFWFVLRHEIEHLLRGHGKAQPVSADLVDVNLQPEEADVDPVSVEEKEANDAAANFCVPADQLESFFVRKFPYISERDTLAFAKRVQRHPGIVVGQLQRKMGRYDWLSRHKVRVRTFLQGSAIMDGWGEPVPVSL